MSAAPELKKQAQDKLTRWIELDQRVVSYRELAREFGVNINVAKNLMTQHYRENQNLFPTYLITGQYLPSINSLNLTPMPSATQVAASESGGEVKAEPMDVDSQESVKTEDPEKTPTKVKEEASEALVKTEAKDSETAESEALTTRGMLLVGGNPEMQAKKHLFVPESLHIQIHSLSAFRITDPEVYLHSTARLRAIPGYNDAQRYGTITGGFEMVRSGVEMTKAQTNVKQKQSATTSKPVPSKPTTVFSKPAAVSKPAPVLKSASASTESAKGKGKAKATKQEDDEPMLRPGKLSGRSSKRVIRSESPEEEEVPKVKEVKIQPMAVSMPTNTSSKPLQDLDIADEDRLAMEAMMDMSDNFDMPSSSAMVQPMDEDDEESGTAVRGNKRTSASRAAEQAAEVPEQRTLQNTTLGTEGKVLKKRRVTKSVEKKNKRGFAYFEDVSTDEDYWSDGTSAAAPSAKKATTKVSALKRNASTTSVSTKGEDDADSASQASAGGKKVGVAKTKAGAAITSGTKSGGTGKTSATGPKPPPAKKAGQTSMFSYFKKQ